MSLADAFAGAEAAHAAAVRRNTWGHLAPVHRKKYPGKIIFTIGEYGGITVIQSAFKNLGDSPWFYEHQQDYIYKAYKDHKRSRGAVLEFKGTYMMFNNGGGRFTGKVTTLIRAAR